MGDVPQTCLGAGIGADGGSVTFDVIDTSEGGSVAVSFDVSFFGGHAEGTIVAPICDVD